jgi:hypothetical protein
VGSVVDVTAAIAALPRIDFVAAVQSGRRSEYAEAGA